MGIMRRMIRICKADLHGMMDQIENRELLLRQYLREMEMAIREKEAMITSLLQTRRQAIRERDQLAGEILKLENDVNTAIRKEKDDIARMLIRKTGSMAHIRDDLAINVTDHDSKIQQLRETLKQQQQIYNQIKMKAQSVFREKSLEDLNTILKTPSKTDIAWEPSEEEVELELLKRKETIFEGAAQ